MVEQEPNGSAAGGARPLVLLAAHGERGGAGNDERLRAFVDRVQAQLPNAEVASARLSVEGETEFILAKANHRRVVGLPILFSDGYFHSERLVPAFAAHPDASLAPPLVFWPGFAPFLMDNLTLRLISLSADPRVLLVAHGSARSERSAAAARRVAQQLQARYGRVEPVFLEEAPYAADRMRTVEPPYACVGLFFGAGLHGRDDFASLLTIASRPPMTAFTVGDLPGLATLVADEARRGLAA
ncbi:hypothetical protein GC169_05835 [bacterium]|nr:hypothetical protein [bacterium]